MAEPFSPCAILNFVVAMFKLNAQSNQTEISFKTVEPADLYFQRRNINDYHSYTTA